MGQTSARLCSQCREWKFSVQQVEELLDNAHATHSRQVEAYQRTVAKAIHDANSLIATQERLVRAVESLTLENARLREAAAINVDARREVPPFSHTMWKRMIALCHPDRHDNSKQATEVTQFLLSVRPFVKRPRA